MFKKAFTRDFKSMARTLASAEVCENGKEAGFHSRTHQDGWTISGWVSHDWYYWVNEFEAYHPAYGRVWGDFEVEVCADSEAAFDAFVCNHSPEEWDYWDI